MKTKLIIAFLFTLTAGFIHTNAQVVKDYKSDWDKVTSYTDKGLPASALKIVQEIYAKAKQDKQDAQLVKAVIYMNQLQQQNRENNEVISIDDIEKEIQNSKEPVTSFLKSYLAGIYQNYFQRNRYKLYNRTNTQNFDKNDIATWTIDDFHKKISELYLASIKNEFILQKLKLNDYDALIIKGNVRYLRPTLYDLLAHRALQYFQSSERDITRPAYAFEIDQPEAFATTNVFSGFTFTTKDSLSLQFKAISIYQKLIQLHHNDAKPDALIDVDLLRLQYVREQSVHPDKEDLYYKALQHIVETYGSNASTAQALYLMAQWHQQQNSSAEATDSAQENHLLIAKQITEQVMAQKDSSEGWINAYNLYHQLTEPVLNFELEKVNVPAAPFRMLVTYKNLPAIYLRIIPANKNIKDAIHDYKNAGRYWDLLLKASPLKTWQQGLPDDHDLQQHRTEIKIDALPKGEYFIMASADPAFKKDNNILAMRLTYISHISFVNNGSDYFVLDRTSGQPLTNAAVQIWERKYDYNTGKTTYTAGEDYATDRNGYFAVTKSEKTYRNGYLIDIKHQGKQFFMDDDLYRYYTYNQSVSDEETDTQIFFFTDRSIYRPGQTVYFKGIVVNRHNDGKDANTISNYKTTVNIYDANNQKIKDIPVTSNDYGSFNGSFVLPQSGLNGIFRMETEDDNGSISFRMEEYKRPKFYVEFEKIKETYKLNEVVKVTGYAKAYAGNNIAQATVKYRVVRQARFPYPWIFYKTWLPRSESMEIAHGESVTNSDGKFDIVFKAIPDLTLDSKLQPVFNYEVYADVTDINGEVRSSQANISVGYTSLMLTANIPERILSDSMKTLQIRTENMAGVYQKTPVSITISKLQPEQRLLRPRYWEKPDRFVMTKSAYISYFPHDIYNDEDDPKTWPTESIILRQTGYTDSTGKFIIDKNQFEPGNYSIEIITHDKDNKEIKTIVYTEVYAPIQKPTHPQYIFAQEPQPVEPGQKAQITIGSNADNVNLIQTIQKKDAAFSFYTLNNGQKTFSFPVTENDRGGYGVTYMFVKDNRVYQSNHTIVVPWTNKDLKIDYTSFRDKTLPGATEKWTVNISGYKTDKVAAEMLASMYDASLDQFYKHQWIKPDIWNMYFRNFTWDVNSNFQSVGATVNNNRGTLYKPYNKMYDALLFDKTREIFYDANQIMIRGRANLDEAVVVGYGVQNKKDVTGAAPIAKTKEAIASISEIESTQNLPSPPRQNFNETAFFFPDLYTDKNGSVTFSFTMPEALTTWKFQALAHTRNMAMGYSTKEIVTQKEMMVQPNMPRFIREGDKLQFSTKVVNLSNKEVTGIVKLQLFNAETDEPIDGWFKNTIPQQYFTAVPGQSQAVQFPVEVPYQFTTPVKWRIMATTTTGTDVSLSDGEENIIPVLTNRMLVTESMPLHMRGSGTKQFNFTNLLNSAKSETIAHQSLTVEYTSNPVWYAVQALPYLMEYPYECVEQTWNRYYANSLATTIANSAPRIKNIFEQWKNTDTAALLSNLQKNQELKSLLLEETPWVVQSQNENQQKKNLALLFDLVKMSSELDKAYQKLKQMQSPNGGFVWFMGGPDDRYMTQYILTGIGHLRKLNAVAALQKTNLNTIVYSALTYADKKIKEDYDDLIKNKINIDTYTPSYYEIQYLYMRSFFPERKITTDAMTAVQFFRERAKKTWVQQNKYMQGMIALALYRNSEPSIATAILNSLRETAIHDDEMGMYYKDQVRSWWWYEAPVERQALLIEAFEEAGKDVKTADDLRTWLLKNKQTNNWESTKATAEACYALLLKGTNWMNSNPDVTISLDNLKIDSRLEKQEAGTGYMKKIIPADKVNPTMGNITLSVDPDHTQQITTLPTWGAVYWQYFEDIDKIKTAATPLQVEKKLFIQTNTDQGLVLSPVNEETAIKVGDKIIVRIVLHVDRDMEYVHMKDMRASAFEPVNVLSSYKWQGGLGYYESTKDASTNFFFNYLRKGTYVFEYPVFATLSGNFSNGITSIQSMYAPEFSSHSEGVRVNIK